MSELAKELKTAIQLGDEALSFISSNLGNYMIDKARAEAFDAMTTLKTIDPTKADEIRQLQNIVQRAENFEAWLAEAYQSGQNAEEQLQQLSNPD